MGQVEGLGQPFQQPRLRGRFGQLRPSASRALLSAWSTRSRFSPRCGTRDRHLAIHADAQGLGEQRPSSKSSEIRISRGVGLLS
jgi:hypothetical protein